MMTWQSNFKAPAPSCRPTPAFTAARPGILQRKTFAPAAARPAALRPPPVVHEVLRSPGQPLDVQTRASMEPRFGHDFSHVRVHSGSGAAAAAQAVNALAYTVGASVVFGAGRYSPGTREGQSLIAHELAHVVQQSGARPGAAVDLRINASPIHEAEADHAAQAVLTGRRAQVVPNQAAGIQRVAGVDDAAEAATAAATLAWCVSGALVTAGIDEVVQLGKWAWKGGKFSQNWCKTLVSALFGCVFGVVGGAFERMFLAEGIARTSSAMTQWLIKKLITFGYTQVAGKLGMVIAKAGCVDGKTAQADPAASPDGKASQVAVNEAAAAPGAGNDGPPPGAVG